jgi:photosystem II stability/assembly factor-like uncharacterized protein
VIEDFFALDANHAWLTYGGAAYDSAVTLVATSDGGRNWRTLGHTPVYWCTVQFVTPTIGWCTAIGAAAGSEGVLLYRSDDGGASWRLVSDTSLASRSSPGALPGGGDKQLEFDSPTLGWATIFSNVNYGSAGLWETSDGGSRWVERQVEPPPGSPKVSYDFTGTPVLTGDDGALGLAINPINGDVPDDVVDVSTNAGLSWHTVTPPGPPRDWFVDTLSALQWRLVAGRHILATNDAGRSWYSVTSDVDFPPLSSGSGSPSPPVVDFVTPAIAWIVSTANGKLWRSSDGGHQWLRVNPYR